MTGLKLNIFETPLNSPSNHSRAPKFDHAKEKGTLYVVATPIGHLDDITLRALRVLKKVSVIAAEDTRHTSRLLTHYDIRTRMIAYHEHNEKRQTPKLINRIISGENVALVSDAGTPGISDPGYRLVTAAILADLHVIPIPGASAIVAALSVAALPTDRFTFLGFLPAKKSQRAKQLESMAFSKQTLVIYESPKRVLDLVEDLRTHLGDRKAVLAREMTKHYEEFIRGCLSEIAEQLRKKELVKGECTLLVSGSTKSSSITRTVIRETLRKRRVDTTQPLSQTVKEVARDLDVPKNRVYREALKLEQ